MDVRRPGPRGDGALGIQPRLTRLPRVVQLDAGRRPAHHSRVRAGSSNATVGPKLIRIIAPPPGAFAASTKPPCASAAWRTIASPSPEPGFERADRAR